MTLVCVSPEGELEVWEYSGRQLPENSDDYIYRWKISYSLDLRPSFGVAKSLRKRNPEDFGREVLGEL